MHPLTRREFIKKTLLGASAVALGQGFLLKKPAAILDTQPFPAGQNLGRICVGGEGSHFDLQSRPDF